MSTVAEFTIGTADFVLHGLFERLPAATVELERVVPTGRGVIPYLWVSGADRVAITSAFETGSAVETMQIVDSIDDQHLLRAEWEPDHDGLLSCIAEVDVTLLSAVGTAAEWTFQVRAQRREDIATFQQRCREHDIPITVITVQSLNATRAGEQYGLTAAQREALRLAYDEGYFDEPRTTTLEEIASTMDISRQALAARLRRGHRNLIRETIVRPQGYQ